MTKSGRASPQWTGNKPCRKAIPLRGSTVRLTNIHDIGHSNDFARSKSLLRITREALVELQEHLRVGRSPWVNLANVGSLLVAVPMSSAPVDETWHALVETGPKVACRWLTGCVRCEPYLNVDCADVAFGHSRGVRRARACTGLPRSRERRSLVRRMYSLRQEASGVRRVKARRSDRTTASDSSSDSISRASIESAPRNSRAKALRQACGVVTRSGNVSKPTQLQPNHWVQDAQARASRSRWEARKSGCGCPVGLSAS